MSNRRMRRAAEKARRQARDPNATVRVVIQETSNTAPTGHKGRGPNFGANPNAGK